VQAAYCDAGLISEVVSTATAAIYCRHT